MQAGGQGFDSPLLHSGVLTLSRNTHKVLVPQGAVRRRESDFAAVFDNVVMRVASFATSLGAGASGYVKTQIHGPWKERRQSWWSKAKTLPIVTDRSAACGLAMWGGGRGGAAKLVRACGGCLGARRLKGVADCEKFRGAVKRALIRKHPSQPGELKHLSTRRKRKKNRLRQ